MSQVILFDAIYSSIGLVLVVLSVFAVRFIHKKDYKNYPFGKDALEPLFAFIQHLFMLVLITVNVVIAVMVITTGGNDVDFTNTMLYSLFAMVFCWLVVFFLKRMSHEDTITPLQEAQIIQWQFSFVASILVFAGFAIGFIISHTPMYEILEYIDPVVTIIYSIVFLRVIIKEIFYVIRQILLHSPSEKLSRDIKTRVRKIADNHQIKKSVFKMSEVGTLLTVEVTFVIDADTLLDDICEQDKLRDKIYDDLSKLPYQLWLNINFTADIGWISNY